MMNFMFIILLTSSININSYREENQNDILEPNYVPISFNDFSDFVIYNNNSLIDSTNYDSHITFDLLDGSPSTIRENYVLTFDSYGDCSYFDISLKFHYEVFDIGPDSMTSFYLYTGSYYDYLGNYLGADYSSGSQHLNYAGIYDAWSGNKGKYASAAYINDVLSRYETGYTVPYDCDVTVQLVRNETGLYSLVFDTYSDQLMIGHSWVAGIDKPVNFILIGFSYSFVNYVKSHVTAYEFEADLIFDDYPDTIDPTVTITHPSNDQYIQANSATITWEGYDFESGLREYNIRIDSETWIDVDFNIVYTFYNLSYGNHTVDVIAIDNEDNNATDTVDFFSNFTVIEPDNYDPYLLILTPGNNTVLDSGDVTVTWIGYDLESGIAGYNIKIDDQSWQDAEQNTEYTFYGLANGSHTVYVEAVDNNLNSYICHLDFIVNIFDPNYDTIDPTVTIISPINGSIIPVENITATWTGYDSISGIASYYVRLDYGNWFTVNLDTSCDFNYLKDGLHTLEVKAIDNYSNEFIAETKFIINTTTDEGSGFTISVAIISLSLIFIGVQLVRRKK